MKLKFIIASLLAAVSFSAFADNQNIDVIDVGGTTQLFSSVGTPFSSSGGLDTITFGTFAGMTTGTYDFILNLTGTNVNFDLTNTNLNNITGAGTNFRRIHLFGVDGISPSPLVLSLYGSLTGTGPASYKGDITVASVPEPETYGMLIAGLGMLGFMARRKAAKKSV